MPVGGRVGAGDFERAYQRFVEFYNVRPERIECAPDVMLRFGSLFRGAEDSVLERRGTVMYQGGGARPRHAGLRRPSGRREDGRLVTAATPRRGTPRAPRRVLVWT
jgi:hypothetical protein